MDLGTGIATQSATATAYTKIKVPDFTGIVLEQIRGAIVNTWHSIPIHTARWVFPTLLMIAGIILLLLLRWLYINFLR